MTFPIYSTTLFLWHDDMIYFCFPSVPLRLFMTKERFTLSPSTEDSARRLSWTTRHTQTTSLEFSGTARITSTKWTLSSLFSTDSSVCLSAEAQLQCFTSYLKCNTRGLLLVSAVSAQRNVSSHPDVNANSNQLGSTELHILLVLSDRLFDKHKRTMPELQYAILITVL